jgi:hypothetical protein
MSELMTDAFSTFRLQASTNCPVKMMGPADEDVIYLSRALPALPKELKFRSQWTRLPIQH